MYKSQAFASPNVEVDRVMRMLHRRPAHGNFREHLFWLVDLIYACKSSGHPQLAVEAKLVEDALASLGQFLETGDEESLNAATAQVEQFALQIKEVLGDL